MEVVRAGHSIYRLQYHVVWVCKYRRRVLNPGVGGYLHKVLRKTFGWLKKVYWKETIVWSPGYFVSSVGIDEIIIKRYVEHQGRQDSGQFRMEL